MRGMKSGAEQMKGLNVEGSGRETFTLYKHLKGQATSPAASQRDSQHSARIIFLFFLRRAEYYFYKHNTYVGT